MAEADSAPDIDMDEEEGKAQRDQARQAQYWIQEIKSAEKAQAKWAETAKKIEKIYSDERDGSRDRARKFNVLWSNVETQRPAIFMHTPTPRAVRRYAQKDPVARFAALLIERNLQVSCDAYDFDEEIDQAVRDRLVVGRGQVWAFYEPTILGEGEAETLAYEQAMVEYVPWPDFLTSVARTWREVWWVGRRFYKTRREMRAWFKALGVNPSIAEKIKLDFSADKAGDVDEGLQDERSKAIIWEIHNKRDKQVMFVAPGSGASAIISAEAPKTNFRDFFPCPMPLQATTTAKSFVPRPDYVFYQDQAQELDATTQRIGVLQKLVKLVGIYNATNTALADLLQGTDAKMVGIDNWSIFAEGGGVKGNIEWFPVETAIVVLEKLYLIRDQAKQTLYEVSGIGDILRGATDPDETATAQGIKAKWGSLRQRRNQKRSTTFLDAVFQLKAEIICERFGFQAIMEAAGVDEALLEKYVPKPPAPPPQMPPQQPGAPPPDPAMMQQMQQMQAQQQKMAEMQARAQFLSKVEQLLRNDAARTFRITVQPDSMLEPDRQEEKGVAVEFLTAVGSYMKEAGPLVQMGPEGAKLAGEMLMFAVRRFDKVDELEQTVEDFTEAMSKPRPPAPDPEMVKAEAEAKRDQGKLMIEGRKADAAIQQTAQKTQADVMAIQAKTTADIQGKMATTQADLAIKQATHEQAITLNEQAAAAERAEQEGSPPE